MRDARFRRKILIQSQQMIEELDDIEDQLERFREFDAPAFEVWQRQLFGVDLRRKSELDAEYRAAVERHNQVVTLAKAKRLSMARAFDAYREEELRFSTGGATERQKIAARRRHRQAAFERDRREGSKDELEQTQIQNVDALAVDQLKSTYRKFVRKLHPDRFDSNQALEPFEIRWHKRLWNLAQTAREEKNVHRLEQLYRITLVRLMEFGELTLTDAHDVYSALRLELEDLKRARADAAATPAWEFSRRADLRPLANRVKRRVREDIEWLEAELRDLRGQHAYLEVLGSRPRRRRRSNAVEAQMSFL